MAVKFGRQYELTIYPASYIQTFSSGNTFVDSLKTQATQVSTLLNKIQTISGLNLGALSGILTGIQSQMTSLISLVKSLQSTLGIPAALISNLESQISGQVAGLLTSIEGSTIIPISFVNNFKNNALNQINSLTNYIPQIPSPLTSFTSFINTGDPAKAVVIKNPFTLTFNIKRAALATANTGSFQIYNLAETTRNQLFKDQTNKFTMRRVTLRAGYANPLPIIFDGNIKWCTSYRMQGQNNFITEIEAFDYGFAMVNAFTNKTWNGQVNKQDVINQLVKDVVNSCPAGQTVTPGYIHKYNEVQYNRSINDYSWPILTDETQSSCFIDNGLLNIMSDEDAFTGAVGTINSDTGLLGAPKRSQTWVIVEMLFEPTLAVGQQISLVTATETLYNGVYKIVGVNHFGTISDAIGGKCQSNVSLFSFQKNAQLIPQIGLPAAT